MPLNKTSYFPGSQWNGTEIQYPDRSIFMAPDGYLNNRFIDEILAIENYLLQPIFQQITTIGPTNSILGVTNDGINLEYKILVAGAGIEIAHDTGTVTLSATGTIEETDPVFANSVANSITQNNVNNWDAAYGWGNHANAGYLTNETDPVFANSVANSITQNNVNEWNEAYGWGNHANAGYLTNETDPVFANSVANSITQNNVNEWDAAYGWGNHANAGYLTNETDPVFVNSVANSITQNNVNEWNEAYGWGNHANAGYLTNETDPVFANSVANSITQNNVNEWNEAYGWGNHANAGYLTNETDPVFANSVANSITQNNVNEWDAAYGWGNHANAGYLTNETDPVFANSVANSITQNSVNDWNEAYNHKTTEDAVNGLVSCNGAGGYSAKTIGSDVQAYNAGLADIAALAKTDSNVIVGNGTNWVAENGTTLRTSLGLGTGDSPQFAGVNTPKLTNLATNGFVKTVNSNGTLSIDGNFYMPTISANTTLYIDTAGNDTTGTGAVGSPWATIAKAFTYLNGYYIASGVTVTIQVNDGHYSWAATITPTHNQGNQIVITGQTTYNKTLSSIQSVSGAAGNWTYILNLTDVTNISVNDGLIIYGDLTGGTYPLGLAGCFIISDVDAINNRITIVSSHKHTSSASGNVTGTIVVLKTVITNSSANAFLVLNNDYKLLRIQKLFLIGGGSNIGIYVLNQATIIKITSTVGLYNFTSGVYLITAGYGYGDPVIHKCATGISVGTASQWNTTYEKLTISGCTTGISATYQSEAYCGYTTGCLITGCTLGLIANYQSVIVALNFAIDGCTTGCVSANLSWVSAPSITFSNNGTDATPSVNTWSASYSYIAR